MKRTELQDVSQGMRDIYTRAVESARRKNLDYAIEMMKGLVMASPMLMDAREKLREFEQTKAHSMSSVQVFLAKFKSFFKTVLLSFKKGSPLAAMKAAEEVLCIYVYNITALNILADVARKMKVYEIEVECLELVRIKKPHNEANLRKLAQAYKMLKDGPRVLAIFEQLAAMHPGNLDVQAELRSATAFATMEKGIAAAVNEEVEQQVESNARLKLHAKKNIGDKVLRHIVDIRELVELIETIITEEPEAEDIATLLYELGDLYYKANDYDKALDSYRRLNQTLSSPDPAVDKLIDKIYAKKFDIQIKAAVESGDQAAVDALTREKNRELLARAIEQLKLYPSDLNLRFDLGVKYFENGYIDEAMEQFQMSRKNPQKSHQCMFYMGMCFLKNGLTDMAIEQFENSLENAKTDSREQKESLYQLGCACEQAQKDEKAAQYFKELYRHDINYRDIAQKMKKYYS